MRHLRTARQVVNALGGLDAVCELTGADRKAAWHWVGRAKMFPANQHDLMTRALRRKRARAPAWLWNQYGAKRRAA